MKKTAKSFLPSDISALSRGEAPACIVVDAHDRPLLYMPEGQAVRQGLARRRVVVALFTPQGRLVVRRMPVASLQKSPAVAPVASLTTSPVARPTTSPTTSPVTSRAEKTGGAIHGGAPDAVGAGLVAGTPVAGAEQAHFALPAGAVAPGEAREDTALRLYADFFYCEPGNVQEVAVQAPAPGQPDFCTLYTARIPADLHESFFQAQAEFALLDRDELQGLVQDVPELLQPELAWAVRQPGLFAKGAAAGKDGGA